VTIPGSLTVTVPSNLTAAATRDGTTDRVTLNWIDNANDGTGFTIQRATNASFTTNAVTFSAGANAQSYVNTGAARNVTYYYRVRAFKPGFISGWSNTVSVLTP
jgi:hypothetical protein